MSSPAASLTSRLRVGTLVASNAFRRSGRALLSRHAEPPVP